VKQHLAGAALRFFFFFAGSVLWAGIWLTGFSHAHWLLYVPATLLYVAAATAVCPALIFSRLIFGDKRQM